MNGSNTPKRRLLVRAAQRFAAVLIVIIIIWLLFAYEVLPRWWTHHETRIAAAHPALTTEAPRHAVTGSQIPGDPLNLFIVGNQKQLVATMLAAGWHPADPITLETSIRIAESSVFHRSYEDAPVSNLFLFGRKEDLAFEKPVGDDPRKRHHVRFWQAPAKDTSGHTAWWGAVTYDQSVGLSHTTGQITHHISPDIDGERDALIKDMQASGKVHASSLKPDFQERSGRNGGGDPWESDGQLGIVELAE